MRVITLAKTKELLGITSTDYDTQINRYIPIIDAKIKQMTNNRYNYQIIGNVTSGSTIVEIHGIGNVSGGINNDFTLDDLQEYIEVGMMISGDDLASDTYISEVYYNGYSVELNSDDKWIPAIELSQAATSTEESAELFLGINTGLQPIIAKGIAWLMDQENTNDPSLGWTSRHIGSLSIVRGVDQAAIDGRYGMPVWFVNAFPKYMSAH